MCANQTSRSKPWWDLFSSLLSDLTLAANMSEQSCVCGYCTSYMNLPVFIPNIRNCNCQEILEKMLGSVLSELQASPKAATPTRWNIPSKSSQTNGEPTSPCNWWNDNKDLFKELYSIIANCLSLWGIPLWWAALTYFMCCHHPLASLQISHPEHLSRAYEIPTLITDLVVRIWPFSLIQTSDNVRVITSSLVWPIIFRYPCHLPP